MFLEVLAFWFVLRSVLVAALSCSSAG